MNISEYSFHNTADNARFGVLTFYGRHGIQLSQCHESLAYKYNFTLILSVIGIVSFHIWTSNRRLIQKSNFENKHTYIMHWEQMYISTIGVSEIVD